MVSLLQTDRVRYFVSESRPDYEPLAKLYFCTFCVGLKCKDDLQHEIESHFCPQTLDSWASNDVATLSKKNNRSSNAWHCPTCTQSLTVALYNTSLPSAGDSKATNKKSYYQTCGYCRWNTREVGIPDREFSSLSWTEKQNSNQKRISHLIEHFKYISHKEALDKMSLEKLSPHMAVTKQMQQRYSKLGQHSHSYTSKQIKESLSLKEVKLEASKTHSVDEVEKLPEGIFEQELDITKVTTIEQQHGYPVSQPTEIGDLNPYPMIAFTKHSLRCKGCEHNLIKSDYNPTLCKFKIHNIALKFVPEIRLNRKVPMLKAGVRTLVQLTVINPTNRLISISLAPSECKLANSTVEVSSEELKINKTDETAEFTVVEDLIDSLAQHDNKEVVLNRDGNRIVIACHVTPSSRLTADEMVTSSLAMTYQYEQANSSFLSKSQPVKPPTVKNLTYEVLVDVGRISE